MPDHGSVLDALDKLDVKMTEERIYFGMGDNYRQVLGAASNAQIAMTSESISRSLSPILPIPPGGRGSAEDPIDIDALERGDVWDSPICVDDYKWSSEEGSDNDSVSDSPILSSESEFQPEPYYEHYQPEGLRAGNDRENFDLDESLFLIPEGEESLWCDPDVQDEREEEFVEFIINGQIHPDAPPVPQPIMGACGPKASTLPHFTSLPLSTFIGAFSLEKHAEIEPGSVEFRRNLLASELKNQHILLRGGSVGATKMMERLGVVDIHKTGPKRKNKNKKERDH